MKEIAFKNIVCEMTAILSRPQCVALCYAVYWMTVPQHLYCNYVRETHTNRIPLDPSFPLKLSALHWCPYPSLFLFKTSCHSGKFPRVSALFSCYTYLCPGASIASQSFRHRSIKQHYMQYFLGNMSQTKLQNSKHIHIHAYTSNTICTLCKLVAGILHVIY